MIDFKLDSRLSFDQMKDKYNLTIGEVMRLYCEWREQTMIREEYENEYSLLRDIHKDSNMALNKALLLLNKGYINSLEATIEAQEIIIKDKSAYMEAIAQPKTCDGCAYINESSFIDICDDCIRLTKNKDCYEPKVQP